MENKTSMAEVVSLFGLNITRKGTKQMCPICGKKDFCWYRAESWKCWNNACPSACTSRDSSGGGGGGGNALSLYMALTNEPDAKTAGINLSAALGKTENKILPRRRPTIAAEVEPPQADLGTKDTVYRTLYTVLKGLSPRHIKDMKNRGLTSEEITSLGYATYSWRDSLAREVQNAVIADGKTISLRYIPLFYETSSGWMTVKKKEGICVPYLNEHRQIQGNQLRRNSEDVKGEMPKYIWLSSSENGEILPGGAPQKSVYHFATDWQRDFLSGTWIPKLGKTVLLTEGAMKADIIHAVTGEPVLAIAGVNCQKSLKEALSYIRRSGGETIVDTFDMDYLTNDNVKAAMEKLKAIVAKSGLKYVRKDWDPHPEPAVNLKGYDDYVVYLRKKEMKRCSNH